MSQSGCSLTSEARLIEWPLGNLPPTLAEILRDLGKNLPGVQFASLRPSVEGDLLSLAVDSYNPGGKLEFFVPGLIVMPYVMSWWASQLPHRFSVMVQTVQYFWGGLNFYFVKPIFYREEKRFGFRRIPCHS